MVAALHPLTVYQDECLRMKLDSRLNSSLEWRRHPSSEEFRRCMTLTLRFIRQHNTRYWLSDARSVHYLEVADQNWLVREIIPGSSPLSGSSPV